LKSTFYSEKPKKLEKTSLNVKFFDWDYLHLTALMKETYFTTPILTKGGLISESFLLWINSQKMELNHSPEHIFFLVIWPKMKNFLRLTHI
jgi:hypothetical protein